MNVQTVYVHWPHSKYTIHGKELWLFTHRQWDIERVAYQMWYHTCFKTSVIEDSKYVVPFNWCTMVIKNIPRREWIFPNGYYYIGISVSIIIQTCVCVRVSSDYSVHVYTSICRPKHVGTVTFWWTRMPWKQVKSSLWICFVYRCFILTCKTSLT